MENKILVYHGTSVENGIKIARDGKILSPYEQKLKVIKKDFPKKGFFEKYSNGQSIEDVAMYWASGGFHEREIEFRVKCFSISLDKKEAFRYAKRYENMNGGLVFGVEINAEILAGFKGDHPSIRFVSKKLSLNGLKEVYLTSRALSLKMQIKAEFQKYNLNFFKFINYIN